MSEGRTIPPVPTSKRFRVAFSFASEKRDFVAKVAAILAVRFGKKSILYDKYHKAEFSRADLAFYLPKLYHDEAELIVAVFSPGYQDREWCGLEWRAIFDLLKTRRSQEIMLSRFGHISGEGLFSLAGYVDLDDETPTTAANLILERLALNEHAPTSRYADAPSTVDGLTTLIPHNLPRLQPFFGRNDELQRIAQALDSKSRVFGVIIDGPGGIGKTSLAIRAAHDASPKDFERIIFVSLKTRELDDDHERDLSGFVLSGLTELFNEIARQLERDDIEKIPDSERARALLATLRKTRSLLILDNLESLTKSERNYLLTFVNKLPEGCKVILTARDRMGSGPEELRLQKLGQQPALETLASLAKSNPSLAQTTEAERLLLYHETGGKPLLLRWTAGQIGRGHCLTVADSIAYLRSCPKGNDPLEFVFGDLAGDFSTQEAKVLCALIHFNLPAKVEHITEIVEVCRMETDCALRSLVNRSLVVANEDKQTFTPMALVTDFVRNTMPKTVAEIGKRLEEHAYTLIVENGYQNHDRFPVIEAAWPLVSAALPLLIAKGGPRLNHIGVALQQPLRFAGRRDERLALSIAVERSAAANKSFYDAGLQAYNVGQFYIDRDEPEKALLWAKKASEHWKGAEFDWCQAVAAQLRGLAQQALKDFAAAAKSFRVAIAGFKAATPALDFAAAHTWANLAQVEFAMGDRSEASFCIAEALVHAERSGDKFPLMQVYHTAAQLELNRQRWEKAQEFARKSLSLAEELGDLESIGCSCTRIAKALNGQSSAAEARPVAERAVEILKQIHSGSLKAAEETLAECKAAGRGET